MEYISVSTVWVTRSKAQDVTAIAYRMLQCDTELYRMGQIGYHITIGCYWWCFFCVGVIAAAGQCWCHLLLLIVLLSMLLYVEEKSS